MDYAKRDLSPVDVNAGDIARAETWVHMCWPLYSERASPRSYDRFLWYSFAVLYLLLGLYNSCMFSFHTSPPRSSLSDPAPRVLHISLYPMRVPHICLLIFPPGFSPPQSRDIVVP